MNIHNIFKVIVALVLSSGVLAQAAQPVFYYRNLPWNPNTREHLFGEVRNCVIADEGFRWRNSFNFNINNNGVGRNIVDWMFEPVVDVDGVNLQPVRRRGRQVNLVAANGIQRQQQANYIHSHLSKIANAVQAQTVATNIAVAAITVVVEDNANQLIARSKVLSDDTNLVWIAATNDVNNEYGNYWHIIDLLGDRGIDRIIQNAPHGINCHLPSRSYRCTEGQIIAKLKVCDKNSPDLGNFALLKKTVRRLRNSIANPQNIKLIILHVHTVMDPCAVCTRCLVGLSRFINESIQNETLGIGGVDQNTKFLVEVSSNNTYYPNPRGRDNFCNHQDNPLAIPFGIRPNGGQNNWQLRPTFPPYVVFGIVNRDRRNNNNVGLSPTYNYLHCREHALTDNLPPVQQ